MHCVLRIVLVNKLRDGQSMGRSRKQGIGETGDNGTGGSYGTQEPSHTGIASSRRSSPPRLGLLVAN